MSENTIFILKPDALGDFVLAIHAINLIRNGNVRSKIVLLCSQRNYSLARWCVDVDEVHALDYFSLGYYTSEVVNEYASAYRRILRIEPSNSDYGVLLRWDTDHYGASPLMFALGIKRRFGFSSFVNQNKKRLNDGYDSFYTDIVHDERIDAEAVKNTELARRLTQAIGSTDSVNELSRRPFERYINNNATAAAEKFIAKNDLTEEGFVIISSGASLPFKRLTKKIVDAVVQCLTVKFPKIKIVLIGNSDYEIQLNRFYLERVGVFICEPTTEPLTIGSLIMQSLAVVCGDSFIKHLAAEVRCNVVEISSASDIVPDASEYGSIRFRAANDAAITIRPMVPLEGCDATGCKMNVPHCIESIAIDQLFLAIETCVCKALQSKAARQN